VEFAVTCPTNVTADQFLASFTPVGNLSDHTRDVYQTIVETISQGIIGIKFKPNIPGVYQTPVQIVGHGTVVQSLTVFARPIPSIKLLEGAKGSGSIGVPYIWKLSLQNVQPDQLTIVVKTPIGQEDKPRVLDFQDGTLQLEYTPHRNGTFLVQIKIEGLNSNYLQLLVT